VLPSSRLVLERTQLTHCAALRCLSWASEYPSQSRHSAACGDCSTVFSCSSFSIFVCLFVFGATAPPPQWARASSFTRFLDHTKTHHTQWNSSGRVISPSQRPLLDNKHPCPQRDSNPKYQQTSGRRPTP